MLRAFACFFSACIIALAGYGYYSGAAQNVRVNNDLTPSRDIGELNFFVTAEKLFGSGNYTTRTVIVRIAPSDSNNAIRPLQPCTENAPSDAFACRVESKIEEVMDEVHVQFPHSAHVSFHPEKSPAYAMIEKQCTAENCKNIIVDLDSTLGSVTQDRYKIKFDMPPSCANETLEAHSAGCAGCVACKYQPSVLLSEAHLDADKLFVAKHDLAEAELAYLGNYMLLAVQYRTSGKNSDADFMNNLEAKFAEIKDPAVVCTVLHDFIYSSRKSKKHHVPYDLVMAALGIMILGAYLRTIPLATLLNIGVTYPIAFMCVAQFSKANEVLSFGPELMVSIIIAFSIDYSLFLLKPFVDAAHTAKGEFRALEIDDVLKVLVHNYNVVLFSVFVLCACFMSFLTYSDVPALRNIGWSCVITIVITGCCNLIFLPCVLLVPGIQTVMLQKWDLTRNRSARSREQDDLLLIDAAPAAKTLKGAVESDDAADAYLTITVAGLIMIAAFCGLYFDNSQVADQIATVLVVALSYITMWDQVVFQPSWNLLMHRCERRQPADKLPPAKRGCLSKSDWGDRRPAVIAFIGVCVIVACTCASLGVFGSYAGDVHKMSLNNPSAVHGYHDPFTQYIRSMRSQFKEGYVMHPGQVMLIGNGSTFNATMDCLSKVAGLTSFGNVTTVTNASGYPQCKTDACDVLHYHVIPPRSLDRPSGIAWRTNDMVVAAEMCGMSPDAVPRPSDNSIIFGFEEDLALDAIEAVWTRFAPGVISMLFGITFVFIGVFSLHLHFGFVRSLLFGFFAVVGLLGTLAVSLTLLTLFFPASQTNVLETPGATNDPMAMLWFVVVAVFSIITGIYLDYAILRLHAYHAAMHRTPEELELTALPHAMQVVEPEKILTEDTERQPPEKATRRYPDEATGRYSPLDESQQRASAFRPEACARAPGTGLQCSRTTLRL